MRNGCPYRPSHLNPCLRELQMLLRSECRRNIRLGLMQISVLTAAGSSVLNLKGRGHMTVFIYGFFLLLLIRINQISKTNTKQSSLFCVYGHFRREAECSRAHRTAARPPTRWPRKVHGEKECQRARTDVDLFAGNNRFRSDQIRRATTVRAITGGQKKTCTSSTRKRRWGMTSRQTDDSFPCRRHIFVRVV